MRPSDDETPDRGDGDSLADGVGEVSSSTEPFGDELSDDTYDEDSYGDDTDIGDSYGDDTDTDGDGDGFGDGSGEPDGSVDDGDVGAGDDGTVLETDDQLPELEIVGHENSPFESVGHILEEISDALFGDDGDDDQALAAAASPFDADPADIASDEDLDLTGDGVVDGADLHEATSVFDFGVSGGHHHHDVGEG